MLRTAGKSHWAVATPRQLARADKSGKSPPHLPHSKHSKVEHEFEVFLIEAPFVDIFIKPVRSNSGAFPALKFSLNPPSASGANTVMKLADRDRRSTIVERANLSGREAPEPGRNLRDATIGRKRSAGAWIRAA